MPKRTDIRRVLIIGSGPIVIGQACEFDYAGTQAVKTLKEEGIEVILLNSNPATVMTDRDLAHRTYIEPITVELATAIIERERPDALLATMGGHSLVWMPGKGGWSPHQHAEEMHIPTGLFVAGDAAGCDNVDICALDGAYTASRLAASLGLISDDDVVALAAQLIERRPNRMDYLGTEPLHRQPWQVPLEVNS